MRFPAPDDAERPGHPRSLRPGLAVEVDGRSRGGRARNHRTTGRRHSGSGASGCPSRAPGGRGWLRGHGRVHGAVVPRDGFPAGPKRRAARGAARLVHRREHRLPMRALPEAQGILPGRRREDGSLSIAQGAARPPPPDDRSPSPRHRSCDRTPRTALYPRLHQEPCELPAATRRVRRGRHRHAHAHPICAGR